MRYRSFKYFYVAAILLFFGNLLGSCVVFLQIRDTTHFFLVNPLSYIIPRREFECYRKRHENHVNITKNSFFSRQSIFFHSISCSKMLGVHGACAIEAAARLHPDSEINLLYCSPVSVSSWSSHLDHLVKLNNFRLIGIHLQSYADGTEFEEFWKRVLTHNKIGNERDVVEYIKFLTLHKFGGTVLDLDVIVNKPLEGLGGNWMVRDGRSLATDAMSILRSNLGRNITGKILRLLSKQVLEGGILAGEALSAGLNDLCPGQDIANKEINTCHGFEILEDRLFHPISRENRRYFYETGNYDKQAFAHRLWNIDYPENLVSQRTLYADLTQTFCPSVYSKIYTYY